MADQPPTAPPPPAVTNPYAAVRPVEGIAIAALVVGLVSVIGAFFDGVPGVIMGLVAIFLGLRARGRIKRSNGALGGGGLALAGWIAGVCGLVIGAVFALFLVGLFFAMQSGGKGG